MERSCAYAQPAILALPLVERAPWNAPLMREDLYIFVAAALLRVNQLLWSPTSCVLDTPRTQKIGGS